MRCLLLSRYGLLGASSRVRSYQYLDFLRTQGIDVIVASLLSDDYLRRLYAGQPRPWRAIWKSYLHRLHSLLYSRHYHLLWIEYELFPWLPAWIERLLSYASIPYVVDYDDAVFHRYDLHPSRIIRALLSRKIDRVMSLATLVIVGNDYLAERARLAGARRVENLPTVVDLTRYPLKVEQRNSTFSIGWIGSPTTAPYLRLVQPALAEIGRRRRVRLVLVGSPYAELNGVPIEVRHWSTDSEAKAIQDFDVGIMPLPDNAWARGKCGYKLIQYMASARPPIASPVGINRLLIAHGTNGFLATSETDWVDSLTFLCDHPEERHRMGQVGRRMVEERYCLEVTGPRLAALLREAAGRFN
jgi:glycosyltransferase involved in cell wall biosynthesis